ncbi:MAG: class I SAM-dependent methyltransferase [Acidobacteria bacterium]|nr:class I SAM-dependent methyltransferase [Acidobacteriota bacterium]
MNSGTPRVHIVKTSTGLPLSVNPYISRLSAVRYLSYARFQAALDLVEKNRRTRVLDFGCWAGYFLPSLLMYFNEVWGVDDDSASVVHCLPDDWTILQSARRLCASEAGSCAHLGLANASGRALPFPNGYFDVAFCLDTLAHVTPVERLVVLQELRRITNPNGQLIFSLPVERGLISVLKRTVRTLTGKQIDARTKEYDYRVDLALLQTCFRIVKSQFVPAALLGTLNPIVMLDCRIEQERFEDSSREPDLAVI